MNSGSKMKLAIPEHRGRVAPVFDTCRRILIFEDAEGESPDFFAEDWSTAKPFQRVTRLKDLEVQVLLCGGISCWTEERIRRLNIALVAWLAGEVGDILTAFKQGRISDPQYAMPGRRMGWRHAVKAEEPGLRRCCSRGKGVHKCLDLTEEDRKD